MDKGMHVLVTGATGFIGTHVCHAGAAAGYYIRAVMRDGSGPVLPAVQPVGIGRIDGETEWAEALVGADTVIHLAGRAHVFEAEDEASKKEFFAVNYEGTANLARQAAQAGVRRFVFVSSIGVNGLKTPPGEYFDTNSPARPHNAYAESKWQAELALCEIAAQSGMESVILRPPLVYGPGNRGNFLKLMKLVGLPVPLPFASIDNRRSLVYVGNLADAIVLCCSRPQAANRTYLVSDGTDVSTSELMASIAVALGQRSRLFTMPPAVMRLFAGIASRAEAIDRLTESLVVDSSAIRDELGWQPPFSFRQGLAETAAWFRSESGAA